MALHTREKNVGKLGTDYISNYNMFINQLKNTLTYPTAYHSFNYDNVRKIELNGKIIFLWLDVKGQVCYCFNLIEKDFDTTSLSKLDSLLTSYFGVVVKVVNNYDEINKKTTDRLTKLNKSISDYDRHNSYIEYSQSFKTDNSDVIDIEYNDINSDNLSNIVSETKESLPSPQYQQKSVLNQDVLYRNVIELNIYQTKYNENVRYLCSDQLPAVIKEKCSPAKKEAFYYENGLLIRNTYISTEYMTAVLFKENIEQSFIFILIFYMAKKDINKAMDIFVWIAYCFNFLGKLPYILALYAKEDAYMNLFYKETLVPLLNSEHAERIGMTDLNKKSLCEKLDKKVIYNLHNITSSEILDAPTKEFTRRLIHKDEYKLNNKNLTTVANTLVTSTSGYIPLIANNVPSVVVNVESSIKILCEEMGIANDYYVVANLIENDLQNFAQITRSINMNKLNNIYRLNHYKDESFPDILDGDANLLKVFETSIKNGDKTIFQSAIINEETEALVEELEDDFDNGRVYKQKLLDYFSMLFGKHYKNNTALIKALKSISQNKEKPFDSNRQFQIKGKVYYQI